MAGFFGSAGRAMSFGAGGQKPPQQQMGGGNGGSFAQKQPMMGGTVGGGNQSSMRTMAQGMASAAGGGMQQRPQPMVQPQRPQMQQRPMQPVQQMQQNPMQQRASPQQNPGIGPRMGGGMGIQAPMGGGGFRGPLRPGGGMGGGYNSGGAGPSFGNDPSGAINRRNPGANPDMPFVQHGNTGGYLDNVGVTIGEGRSITPQQYQAQIAQAKAAGIPDSYIQNFLRGNPGDSNRLLESYQSEDGGKYKDQMISAQQTPWQSFVGQGDAGGGGGGNIPDYRTGIGPRPGGGYNHWGGGGGGGWNPGGWNDQMYPQMQNRPQVYY